MATKKIIRVLVYEGEEALVLNNLQRRYVVTQRSIRTPGGDGYTITETFVDDATVRTWLGEEVSPQDLARAQLAVGEVGIVGLDAAEAITTGLQTLPPDHPDVAGVVIDASKLLPLITPCDVECPSCEAGPGEPCRGLKADTHHFVRYSRMQDVHRARRVSQQAHDRDLLREDGES